MFKETFENYLQEICFKENPMILDDDMPDFFEKWLDEQEVAGIMKYAEERVAQLNKMVEGLTKLTSTAIDELKKLRDMAKERNSSLDEALNSGNGTYKP